MAFRRTANWFPEELPNLEEMLANLERQRLPLTPPPEDPERSAARGRDAGQEGRDGWP